MGATSYGVGFADWTGDKPDHWVFEGTNMKKGDRVAQLVGWEYHGPPLAKHPDMVVLSQGPVYGANGEKRTGTYATTIYTAPRAISCSMPEPAGGTWCSRLRPASRVRRARISARDGRIQRITRNILTG